VLCVSHATRCTSNVRTPLLFYLLTWFLSTCFLGYAVSSTFKATLVEGAWLGCTTEHFILSIWQLYVNVKEVLSLLHTPPFYTSVGLECAQSIRDLHNISIKTLVVYLSGSRWVMTSKFPASLF
jgi:hypothetical protein